MNWAVLISAALLHFVANYFFANDYVYAGYVSEDLQILLFSLFGYMVCPYYKFHLKTIAAVAFGLSVTALIHNVLIYSGVWDGVLYPFVSALLQFILSVLIGFVMVTRFDHMPTYKIVSGKTYEVMGRPKNALQYIAFFLTVGRCGNYAITDGVSLFKFCRDTGKMEELPFSGNYINGKKCLPIDVNIDNIRAKVGSDWSLINNCLTMRFWT